MTNLYERKLTADESSITPFIPQLQVMFNLYSYSHEKLKIFFHNL